MATITHRLGHFTGQVGSVRFHRGVGQTHDPDMVAYFEADPDTYDVEHDEQPELPDTLHDLAADEQPNTDED